MKATLLTIAGLALVAMPLAGQQHNSQTTDTLQMRPPAGYYGMMGGRGVQSGVGYGIHDR